MLCLDKVDDVMMIIASYALSTITSLRLVMVQLECQGTRISWKSELLIFRIQNVNSIASMFLTDVLKIGIKYRKKMGIDRVCVFDSKESMMFTGHHLLQKTFSQFWLSFFAFFFIYHFKIWKQNHEHGNLKVHITLNSALFAFFSFSKDVTSICMSLQISWCMNFRFLVPNVNSIACMFKTDALQNELQNGNLIFRKMYICIRHTNVLNITFSKLKSW